MSNKAEVIIFSKITDERGNLTPIEQNSDIPFDIKRVYWISDIPGGQIRGSHAYRNLEECLVALAGSFDVFLHDGEVEKKYTLNRSNHGLFIPKLHWRRLENFSTNSVCLVLASEPYDEDDYIKEFDEFKKVALNG
jgi:hypothetical protein